MRTGTVSVCPCQVRVAENLVAVVREWGLINRLNRYPRAGEPTHLGFSVEYALGDAVGQEVTVCAELAQYLHRPCTLRCSRSVGVRRACPSCMGTSPVGFWGLGATEGRQLGGDQVLVSPLTLAFPVTLVEGDGQGDELVQGGRPLPPG